MSLKPRHREPSPLELVPPSGRGASMHRRRRRTNVVVFRDFQPHALAIEDTPPSPFTALLLWSLGGLLVSALVWAYLSSLPIMTTAPAKFVPSAHTKVVQSLNAGTVRGIFVRPGDKVFRGEILVSLDPGGDIAKLSAAGSDVGLNSLEQQRILRELGLHGLSQPASSATGAMATLEKRLAASQAATERSKLEVDRAQVREAQANLSASQATLTEYAQRAAQDTALAKAAFPLTSEGALSGQQYTQLADQAIVDEGQLRAQRQQVTQLAAALLAARKQLDTDARTFESDRYQDLESTLGKSYDLKSQYRQAGRALALDGLRAPVDGTVQSIGISSLGTVVQPGQTVATVVPQGAPLVVEVDLPAQDAGFVKVGQKTQIKVTAYPFEQYGSIPGKVVWISPMADATPNLASLPDGEIHQPAGEPSQGSSPPGSDQTKADSPPTLYFRIRVQPERTWLAVDGQRRIMRPGMTASVDVETGHRRLLDFFLDPIVKYLSNGLTVR